MDGRDSRVMGKGRESLRGYLVDSLRMGRSGQLEDSLWPGRSEQGLEKNAEG